jgi:HPt (histidine-containing phosphotransfer) domain-containing protein
MTALPLTEELLARAQAKLEQAKQALAANPTNEWLRKAVLHERDKVTSLRRTLSGKPPE